MSKWLKVTLFAAAILAVASLYFYEKTFDWSVESLLSDQKEYRYSPTHGNIKFAQYNLEDVLSSPRACELLRRLKLLPRSERERKCKQMFARAFAVHTNTFRVIFDRIYNTSLPLNQQSTRNTQLTVCMAMYAAAEMGARELMAEEFAQLDKFKAEMEQRRERIKVDKPGESVSWMKLYDQPDYRFQVNTLCLLAAHAPGRQDLGPKVEEACARAGMRKEKSCCLKRECVSYRWRPDDLCPHYYDKQERVVSELRKIVLQ